MVIKKAPKTKGENFYRDKKKLDYIHMLKGGKPIRDKTGKITKAAPFQSKEVPEARMAPHIKYFENVRVIGPEALEKFREKIGTVSKSSYQFLLKRNKLPMSLLTEPTNKLSSNGLLEVEPFSKTFGPNAQRKKPKLLNCDYNELAKSAELAHEKQKEKPEHTADPAEKVYKIIDPALTKGQSKRIWNELYKVIDSSDVIIMVLDARDPNGTRCIAVENYLRKEKQHKHLIYLINKCDLIPSWATKRWVQYLSQKYPTLAFHASMRNSFGKGALIQLLRQFSIFHKDKKQISVGLVGFPNVGKSSVINTLKHKKVCSVAPIPGATKVWEYISLMKRIYLIDCPGIIHGNANFTDTELVLRGVIRTENIQSPEDYIGAILETVRPVYLRRNYEIEEWTDTTDFLSKIARRYGKLIRGGEPNISLVSKMVINDYMRGKLPYFHLPPDTEIYEKLDQVKAIDASIHQDIESIQVEQKFMDIDMVPPMTLNKKEKNSEVHKEQDSPLNTKETIPIN